MIYDKNHDQECNSKKSYINAKRSMYPEKDKSKQVRANGIAMTRVRYESAETRDTQIQ